MKQITLFIFMMIVFMFQCKEPAPLDIQPLKYQGDAFKIVSMIPKDDYKTDGNYQAGYENGKILSDRIILTWQESKSSGFLCYKIFRNNAEIKSITDKKTTMMVDSGLFQNNYYNYRLVNMTLNGMYSSDTVRIKTPRFQRPEILAYQVMSDSRVKIFWNNLAESADKFDVYRRLTDEPDSAAVLVATSTDTFYTDSGVADNGQYIYTIIAYNDYERTQPSDPFFVIVSYNINPPTLLAVDQSLSDRTVNLLWGSNSNSEEGYRIYRRPLGGNYRLIAQVPLTVHEYVDTDTTNSLKNDSTYCYALRAYNSQEVSDLSNEDCLNIVVHSGRPGNGRPGARIRYIKNYAALSKVNE